MALVKATIHGAQYKWGFQDADAPTIAGVTIRQADLKIEPEVSSMATDGEGHVDSMVVSKPAQRKITGTFTGYCTPTFNPSTPGESFSFGSPTRFFIITSISQPIKKGDYAEVSIEGVSYPGITS